MTSKSTKDSRSGKGLASPTLDLAKAVLKPLLSKQGAKLDKLNAGDNAVTFELNKLSLTFKPQNCKVLSEISTETPNSDGEKQTFYILDVAGHLVRLAAFKAQASSWIHAIGAIYTGDDQDAALEQALASAKRLR
jgi:hypothetical protein